MKRAIQIVLTGAIVLGVVSVAGADAPSPLRSDRVFPLVERLQFPLDTTPLEAENPATPHTLDPQEYVIGADGRTQINNTTDWPWRAVVKTLQQFEGDTSWYTCSAAMIQPNWMLTAAHCVWDLDRGVGVERMIAIPGANGDREPYGRIYAEHVVLLSGYVDNRDSNYDIAWVRLTGDAGVGHFGWRTTTAEVLASETLHTAGYPAAQHDGWHMYHSREAVSSVTDTALYHTCDTEGGQSGSGLWHGEGYLVGIHSGGLNQSNNFAVRLTGALITQMRDSFGQCHGSCQVGARECVDDNTAMECVVNAEHCSEWRRQACGANEVCEAGRCVTASNCAAGEFECASGECVPGNYICDQDADCADGSDERGCGACSASQFRCDNGQCVTGAWYCDHDNDCGDWSDEQACDACDLHEYRCPDSGDCVDDIADCFCTPDCAGLCAGAADGCGGTCAANDCDGCCTAGHACLDGDSEWSCGTRGAACDRCGDDETCSAGVCVTTARCAAGEFECANGDCIEAGFVCDRDADCADGSDERDCPPAACDADSHEPDDGRSTGTELDPGTRQTHSICPAGDVDWWEFTINRTADVIVETSGSEGDTRLWLHGARGESIATDDDGGSGYFSRLEINGLAAGTYHLRVEHFDGQSTIATYRIRLTVEEWPGGGDADADADTDTDSDTDTDDLGAKQLGEACQAGVECASGVCFGGEYCTRSCAILGCPDDYDCVAFGGADSFVCKQTAGGGAGAADDDDPDGEDPVGEFIGGCSASGTSGGTSGLVILLLLAVLRSRRAARYSG